MNNFVKILALALPLGATAAPLSKELVSSDAKWVLHLDADQLRSTKVGSFLVKNVLDEKLREPKANLKKDLGFDLDITQINSITVYGTDFEKGAENTGVLLIKTDLDPRKSLDAFIATSALSGGESPIKKTEEEGFTQYAVGGEFYVGIFPNNLVVLSKAKEPMKKEAEIVAGKGANMSSGKAFTEYKEMKKAFFFLGLAQGFSEDAAVPPQAKVFKMADGGRVVLGEDDGNLFLNLALKGKNADVLTQMQAVIQGTIALGLLAQDENQKDLTQLAQSAKVTTSDNILTLNLEFPADRAIQHIDDENQEKGEHHEKRAKHEKAEKSEKSDKGDEKKDN
jgi:hypothetical protein